MEKLNSNKNNETKMGKFLKSTKTSGPTSYTGATSLPPIGDNFMYSETSSINHGNNFFVSFERTDIIQISNIIFFYNRFSILTDHPLRSMGQFKIELLLEDIKWNTQYSIPEDGQNSNSSTDWTLPNLIFTLKNGGRDKICDQIDTAHSDMCFSNITITNSVY